jgi:hypothetical protein
MLTNINEFVLFFVAVGAFFVAIEAGFRLGLRHRPSSDDGAREHVYALQAALLGLLALLLGFNFAMASSRFDARKALMQDEVNTIGTAWLRAQLLPQPQRDEISGLLRGYVSARIDFMRAGTDEDRLESSSVATTTCPSPCSIGCSPSRWGRSASSATATDSPADGVMDRRRSSRC